MVEIDKYIQTNRKSIKIEITPLGEVIVYAPKKSKPELVNKFINSKAEWIEKNKNKVLSYIKLNNDIFTYDKVLLLGNTIKVVERNEKKSEIINDILYISKSLTNVKKVSKIEKFLKIYAGTIIENRLNYFSNLMQLEPNMVKFSNAKKRWGSCDSKGNILFNWRIVMLTPDLIDYIIVHELSHLIEMNHSYDFWRIVASIIPDWKERRQTLKSSNFILSTFRTI